LNLYAYVGNNPVNLTDPSGLSRQDGTLLAGGGALAIGDALARSIAAAGANTRGLSSDNSGQNPKIFVTYTKEGPNGEIYAGRSSGFGTPQEIVDARDKGHTILNNVLGYKPAKLDQAAVGERGANAIRGREQQIIDFNGGTDSPRVGNIINGISAFNLFYYQYMFTSYEFFGPYTGKR
jgi:hypothetical protein